MAISKDDLLQYQWLGREEGYTALEHEIIFRDLCCGCGACAAVCPEKVIEVGEFPKLVGKCTNCGYCLMQCPRSFFSSKEAEEKIFGSMAGDVIGHCEVKLGARAKDAADKVQDGGFVTALLKYCLEKKIIDGAVVAGVSEKEPWKPAPRLITSPAELGGVSGTKYSNCSNLSVLKEAMEKNLKNIAVVGVHCQIEGARKIQNYPIEDVDLQGRIKLTVALFCKSNFLYDGLMKNIIQKKYNIDLKKMSKIDIKGKNVLVWSEGKKIEIPLEEAYSYAREGCKVCLDFTSRISDFSVGSVGSPGGYSTVLARTKLASEILNKMKSEGAVETIELQEEKPGLEVARALQATKAKDSKAAIRKRIREVVPPFFKYLEW